MSKKVEKISGNLETYVKRLEEIKKTEEQPRDGGKKKKMTAEERAQSKKHEDMQNMMESKNYGDFAYAVKDKMFLPKVSFFGFLADEMEPFLTKFQTNAPMVPFLHSELTTLVENLANRVVKPEVLQTSAISVDYSRSENLISAAVIDLGFATKTALKNNPKSPSGKDVLVFRRDCRDAIVGVLKKLQEKSPLKYKMTVALSCLDPAVVCDKPDDAKSRFDDCLEVLVNKGFVSSSHAENAKREYADRCRTQSVFVRDLLQSYSRNCRVDKLWVDVLRQNPAPNFFDVLTLILIMSHGQGTLERGFSANEDCLVPNLDEKSLTAQRIVYDSVMNKGGLDKMMIDKRMIQDAGSAHGRYQDYMVAKRKEESKAKSRKDKK